MSARPARFTAAGQLALELPLELPPIALAPEWKDQQRLWGHAFHPMCSYLASFPAALTHAFIARYSRPGDVVLDPFSGRGTTPLQACAEGRVGVGNDLNPFAHLLTAAKVEPATRAQAMTRLAQLRLAWNANSRDWLALGARISAEPGSPGSLVPTAGSDGSPLDGAEPVPLEVALAFHPRTLGQLLFVRTTLHIDDRTDRFLAAAITGILHGKSASYLSELMPNTFSMAPRYVRDFAARTAFASPERDVFDGLSKKLDRLFRQPPPSIEGVALLGDARDVADVPAPRCKHAAERSVSASWSPRRRTCGSSSTATTTGCGRGSWASTHGRSTRPSMTPTIASRTCCSCARSSPTFGRSSPTTPSSCWSSATSRRTAAETSAAAIGLAERTWVAAAEPEGYRLAGVALDDVAAVKKMTKLWGDEAGRATKTDRILVLGATEAGRRRALAGAPLDVDWTWPPRALRSL